MADSDENKGDQQEPDGLPALDSTPLSDLFAADAHSPLGRAIKRVAEDIAGEREDVASFGSVIYGS